MCMNKECPLRESCYRFKATPNKYRQSYAIFKFEDNSCEHFWDFLLI